MAPTSARSSSARLRLPAAGIRLSHVIPEDDSLPMEFGDDTRSIVTEVSGLTMLTMEQQPVGVQSRKQKQNSPSLENTDQGSSFAATEVKSREVSKSPQTERETRMEYGSSNDPIERETRESPADSPILSKSSRKAKEARTSKKLKKDKKKKNRKRSSKKSDTIIPSDDFPLEDVSFSGLFSTIEAESLAGRLDSSQHHPGGPNPEQYLDDSRNPFDERNGKASTSFVSETPASIGQAAIDTSTHERTTNRSYFDSNASDVPKAWVASSNTALASNGNVSTFSEVVSVFEARSGMEPPETRRLVADGGFPINGDGKRWESTNRDDTTFDQNPESSEAFEFEGKLQVATSDASSSHTIGDESTIPPPPLADDISWNEGLLSPPTNEDTTSSRETLNSACILATDEMSTFSLENIESNCSKRNKSPARWNQGTATSKNGTAMSMHEQKGKTQVLLTDTSLEYSESAESSLQYSDSTAPTNVVSDIPSLLASAAISRSQASKEQHQGPIDLDEFVEDTYSDTSSLYGTASLPEQRNEVPSKTTPVESMPLVTSPLNYEDDEEEPFVDDEEEEAFGTDGEEESYPSRPSLTQFDEALVERSYKETMESLGSRRHGAGSILLTEEELDKHAKSTQFKAALPSSSLKGYDSWKKTQFEKEKYFAQIHKKAMKRKEEREGLTGSGQLAVVPLPDSPSLTSEKRANHSKSRGTASVMERSMSSTIQTSRSTEPILQRKKNMLPSEPKRGWSFLRGKARNGDLEATSHQSSKKSKSPKKMKKKEPAVVTLEDFIRISSDEPDDTSIINMRQSGFCGLDFTVNSVSLPAGDTDASVRSRSLGDSGVRPHLMALQHLEMERAKNRKAEKDKNKLEIREQRRIALLKERELDRQRRLNNMQDEGLPPSIFNHKQETSSKTEEADQFLHRNLSFGTTNTAQSSIRSPSCVLSPCVVCNAAERTHMAQPCNHFYYCQDCAQRLRESATPVCPVCSTTNVSFSRVYT
ncbi:MAG: hypothetical protein SGILL_000523 [Bacillariaceae sp.]